MIPRYEPIVGRLGATNRLFDLPRVTSPPLSISTSNFFFVGIAAGPTRPELVSSYRFHEFFRGIPES